MAISYDLKPSSIWARTPDGTGNNLERPEWGAAETTNRRITANSYADGKGAMAPEDNLPQPRSITDAVMAQPKGEEGNDQDMPDPGGANEFFQFFGQFLAHDINQTRGGTEVISPFPGGFPSPDGDVLQRNDYELDANGVRQHVDLETSFLDLGTVYGRSQATIDLLRADLIDENGDRIQSAKLLVGTEGLAPTLAEVAADAGIATAEAAAIIGTLAFGPVDNLYALGDDRGNQTPALLAPHMVFLRNHNWHVDQLAAKHADWSQEDLFNAARALNEAEWQHVVYSEYLARLVGKDAIRDYKGYKSGADPSIINEFASVAFRFGHDQSSNLLKAMDEGGDSKGNFTLAEAFALGNTAQAIRTSETLDDWIRGLSSQHTQELDGKVVDGNRNALFGIGATIDLMAIDIMRGRDQGTGNYNDLREGLGFKTYKSFDAFGRANRIDGDTLAALKEVYDNDINKLDSLVGGLLEKEAKGSMLGETFTKIIVLQFEALRDGDRYFHLNQLKGEEDLLRQIESTALADILERTTGIEHVYHDAFAAHERFGGTAKAEALSGTAGHDLLMGFGGNDTLNAGAGNDDLYGGDGSDNLRGGAGDDIVNGGKGDDLLWGGGSNGASVGAVELRGVGEAAGDSDTFVFERGSGHDRIMDFHRPKDKIDLSDFGIEDVHGLEIVGQGRNSIIDFGNGDVLEVVGVRPQQLGADNFILV